MSVYRIYNKDSCYIGSTKLHYVSSRISKHKYLYKTNEKYQCECKKIFDAGEWEWEILEKEIPQEQLKEREKYYIETTENCINKYGLLMTRKEIQRKYYDKNKEEIIEKQRQRDRTEKILCECGKEIRKADIARHRKTKYHIEKSKK